MNGHAYTVLLKYEQTYSLEYESHEVNSQFDDNSVEKMKRISKSYKVNCYSTVFSHLSVTRLNSTSTYFSTV